MSAQSREIGYRRMVSNLFRELGSEDVQQIAYVRLKGKEDITKYSAAKQTLTGSTALDLMQALERHDVFSQDNIDGVVETMKDAQRNDLVKKIKAEKLKMRPSPAVRDTCSRIQQNVPATPTGENAQTSDDEWIVVDKRGPQQEQWRCFQRELQERINDKHSKDKRTSGNSMSTLPILQKESSHSTPSLAGIAIILA